MEHENTAEDNWVKIREGIDAGIFSRDGAGSTILHLQLSKGCFCKDCVDSFVEMIEVILAEAERVQKDSRRCRNELKMANMVSNNNKTPLHYVVENMVPMKIVQVLVKYGASLTEDEKRRDSIVPCTCGDGKSFCGKMSEIILSDGIVHPELAEQMVLKYPEVLELLFNHGVKFKKGGKSMESADMLELDLRRLIHSEKDKKDTATGWFNSGYFFGRWAWQETEFLHQISAVRNQETSNLLLNHPLTLAFEKHKGRLYSRLYHWEYMFIYACYIAVFYGFITKLYFYECKWDATIGGNATNYTDNSNDECRPLSDQTRACLINDRQFGTMITLAFVTLILWLVPVFVELRKLGHFGWREYLKLWQSYVTVLTLLSVYVPISPILFFRQCLQLDWEYSIGAVSTLLCALSVMIHCNPSVSVTVYTEMLFKVLWEILKASASLIPLFIGYYLSFRMLGFQEDINPFRLLTMVFSDTDYEEIMTDGRGFSYIFVCYIVFISFITLVLIVVINFLIGVAVSDVQELKTRAKLSALSYRISSYFLMDCIYGGRGWHALTARSSSSKKSAKRDQSDSAIYGGDRAPYEEGDYGTEVGTVDVDRFLIQIYPLKADVDISSEKYNVNIPLKMRRSLVDLARENCTTGRRSEPAAISAERKTEDKSQPTLFQVEREYVQPEEASF